MICIECLGLLTTACETKRKVIEADRTLKSQLRFVQPAIQMVETVNEKSEEHHCDKSEGLLDDGNRKTFRRTRQSVKANIKRFDPTKLIELSGSNTKENPCDSIIDETLQNNVTNKSVFKTTISNSKISSSLTQSNTKLKILKQFSCDLCTFDSLRKKNVERHIMALHLKLFKFECTEKDCSREYTTRAALALHYVRDHDNKTEFNCNKCKAKFSCKSLLKIHAQRLTCRPRKNKYAEKSIEKTLLCSYCDFKTAHKFSLTQHTNLKHLNLRKTWKCSHCENTEFSSLISLKLHMFDFHNLSHIRCPECDQAFLSDDQLTAHKDSLKCNARVATDKDFEETSTGIKCNLCQRSYRSKKEWTTHYFNHHKFDKVCDICNIQLSTYASLKNHKKTIHEKIKAFKCTECPKEFSAKHTLQFHLNAHSGICFLCNLGLSIIFYSSFQVSNHSGVNSVRSKHQIEVRLLNIRKNCIQT